MPPLSRDRARALGMTESARRAAELGVGYQVYPRSFLDTDGDGVGDLEGLCRRADYLAWLGVDTVWLSPIYPSPMADLGYDVADHTDVDPLFGTLDDLQRLVDSGLQVLLDWVPNHTSVEHPWFRAARSSTEDPRRDWYLWRDPAPGGGPPNNWIRHFADEPAWTFDAATGQYYLHSFLPDQPDVNWANPEVRAAMHEVLRFWLDRGVRGFRADVVHLIGKDPELVDDPPHLAGRPRAWFHDCDVTMSYLAGVREVLDEYEASMVGEVNLPDAELVARYIGDDRLPTAFFFGLLHCPWAASSWRDTIHQASEAFERRGAWPTWALGNHDQPRMVARYGSLRRAHMAAVVLLTLRGTPFLYAGDEFGLEDATVPAHRTVDPGGRDGCRAPIPWDMSPCHGWPVADPWLPWPPRADYHNLQAQRADPGSTLHLHRRLLAERRASRALWLGGQAPLDLHDNVVAYRRDLEGDARVVVANFGGSDVAVPLTGEWTVAVASDGVGEGAPFTGEVAAETALVLRPSERAC